MSTAKRDTHGERERGRQGDGHALPHPPSTHFLSVTAMDVSSYVRRRGALQTSVAPISRIFNEAPKSSKSLRFTLPSAEPRTPFLSYKRNIKTLEWNSSPPHTHNENEPHGQKRQKKGNTHTHTPHDHTPNKRCAILSSD